MEREDMLVEQAEKEDTRVEKASAKDTRVERLCGEYSMRTFQLVRLLSPVDGRKQDVYFLATQPFLRGILPHNNQPI